MIRTVRSLALVLLAMTLGAFQACACAHETHSAGHSAHQAKAAAGAHDHHGVHAATVDAHADACGTSTPECDHAPDASAMVVKASADFGSKLVEPVAYAAASTPPVQPAALRVVGQTGPPVRWRRPQAETPVSLKVRLLN